MKSASHGFLFPFFLITTFLLLSFQLNASPNGELKVEIFKDSGKDNVEEGEISISISMFTKFRKLFSSNFAQESRELVAENLSPLPSFYHIAPSPNLRHGKEEHLFVWRKHFEMIIAISVSVLATLAIFVVMAVLVFVYRKNRRNDSFNKVSFDPEPDMFYLNSLGPFFESGLDHKMSNELKSVTLQPVLDSETHSVEAGNHFESLSSDGSESFHSICCSLCSIECMSSYNEPSLDLSTEKSHFSPLNSLKLNVLSTKSINKSAKSPLPTLVPSSQSANLQIESAASLPFSKYIENSNITAKIPYESRNQAKRTAQASESANKIQTLQSMKEQQIPNFSNCNGRIPKPPPPPPPLPPFQKKSSFGKPVSPPTLQVQQSLAVDKEGNSLPKLKPLHWDKVRAAPDHSMVWDKIRSNSFVLDEKTIESLFGYNGQSSVRTEESKNKNSPHGKQVLEHKRLQNFTILLKTLNATSEQVCNALIIGSGLGTQQLEALAKMVPTKKEEERIDKFEGDIDELGSTENFLKVVLSIPLAFSRIEVMLFKENFEDEVIHLKKSFAILEESCKELRSSKLFMRFLDAVLKTGNRMNIGTIRGGARAFKLDALLKLADIKGIDGKTTLLHFVVQEMNKSGGLNTHEKIFTKNKANNIKEKEENGKRSELELVSALSNELSNVKKTATMDLDVLTNSVSNLYEGMRKINVLVEDLSRNEKDVSFVSLMRSFKKQGEGVIKELKDSEEQVFRNVREITEYYHGDVGKDEVNPLRIFVIVSDFLGILDRVCRELRSSRSSQHMDLVSLARVS